MSLVRATQASPYTESRCVSVESGPRRLDGSRHCDLPERGCENGEVSDGGHSSTEHHQWSRYERPVGRVDPHTSPDIGWLVYREGLIPRGCARPVCSDRAADPEEAEGCDIDGSAALGGILRSAVIGRVSNGLPVLRFRRGCGVD
jgi:hypothetical protein